MGKGSHQSRCGDEAGVNCTTTCGAFIIINADSNVCNVGRGTDFL